MKPRHVLLLLLLATLWGGSFIFIRIAAPALGPVVMVEARVLIAGLVLLIYALAIRRAPDLRKRWRQYFVVGLLNSIIPFTLIGVAELHVTASLAAILNATTPLFAALVAAAWLRERLTIFKGIGLCIGFSGVAVLVGWSPLRVDAVLLLSVGASLLAALSYAIAGSYIKQTFVAAAPLDLAIGQQLSAALILLPFAIPTAIVNSSQIVVSPVVIFAIGMLAIVATSIAYVIYYHLIAEVGPTQTLTVTFLVPIFGVIWGAIFLHELIQTSTIVGLALILASVQFVAGLRLGRRKTAQIAASSRV